LVSGTITKAKRLKTIKTLSRRGRGSISRGENKKKKKKKRKKKKKKKKKKRKEKKKKTTSPVHGSSGC